MRLIDQDKAKECVTSPHFRGNAIGAGGLLKIHFAAATAVVTTPCGHSRRCMPRAHPCRNIAKGSSSKLAGQKPASSLCWRCSARLHEKNYYGGGYHFCLRRLRACCF